MGGLLVSIIRIGLGVTKHFAEGYDAIFKKKKARPAKQKKTPAAAKKKAKVRKK
jgi:hypothetical protein